MSKTSNPGFPKVSAKKSLVFFLILFFISLKLLGSTKVVLIPNLLSVNPNKFLLPPYILLDDNI